MKHLFLLACLVFSTLLLSSQDIKRGFKSLEKLDHTKAKEQFQKIITDNNKDVGANFGLALVFADDQSAEFDIIQAWKHAARMKDRVSELTQEELDIIGEYFIETEQRRTSRPVKKKIAIALETIEDRLIKYVREENDLTITYAVLDNFPDYRHYDNVIHIRNQLEFRKYEKQNTLAGYKEFIQKFPDAAQVPKAKKYIYKLEFDEIRKKNTIADYNQYLKKYPESEYYQTAIKLRNQAAFDNAKRINTMEAYEQFLNDYPEALQVPEAKLLQRELLYNYAKQIRSIDAYNNFIAKYPEGKYYVDIFNLKADELGKQIISSIQAQPGSIMWCKQLDNNRWYEDAVDIAVTKSNEYVIVGNTKQHETAYSDAWIVKLNRDGKMLWNKMAGQPFQDEVLSVMINSKDEILVLGYTYLSADSSSKRGWLFKLGVNGEKIWNKNLGIIDIVSWDVNTKDQIVIGSYEQIDSVTSKCKMLILNEEGRTMWQRKYLQNGRITALNVLENGDILAGAGKWLILTDNRRYLKWEDTLAVNGQIVSADYSVSPGYVFGINTDFGPMFICYTNDGKKNWSKQFSAESIGDEIENICLTNSRIVSLEGNNYHTYVRVIDASGSAVSQKSIRSLRPVKVIADKEGKLLMLLGKEDFVVLKLANAFL